MRTNRDLQREIVEGLAAGKDVQALLDQLRTTSSSPATPLTPPPTSTEAADLQNQLADFRATLRAIIKQGLDTNRMDKLVAGHESLRASHLLFVERFKSVQTQLDLARSEAVFSQRREAAEKAYDSIINSVFKELQGVLTAIQQSRDRTALSKDGKFRTSSKAAIKRALALLDKHQDQAATPILRASVLPYRQAKLSPRTPVLTPAIQPSYLSPADTNPPQTADVSGTLDAPLSAEILQKARELEHDYIRIYEFVHNSIKTEWYAGAMKGAVGTLRQGSGNDIDQASLLIALFRASGLPARYVTGVVEVSADDVMQSLGLREVTQASNALTRAGIAAKPIIRGGVIAAFQIEHTWVAAHVPYTNYRGAMVDGSGKTWLPLAPALKRYEQTSATGILRKMALSIDTLVDTYLSGEQPNDLLEVLRKNVTDYVQANKPDETYEQQLGSHKVVPEYLGLIPNTLPVNVIAVTGETAELADSARQRVRFVIRQGTGSTDTVLVDYTVPVSEIASERVTLSYMPATIEDHKVTNLFGGLDYVPAYLIRLRPQIKVNGQQKSVGRDTIDTGVPHRFELHVLGPAGTQKVETTVISGTYHAIGISAQGVAQRIVEDDPADTEFRAAKLLRQVALDYGDRWNRAEAELGGLLDVAVVRPFPSVAIASNLHKVDMVLGRPHKLTWQGVTLDAALRISEPVARSADAVTTKDWMRLSALQGSALEHVVFEKNFLVDSISADKGLALARAAGIPIVSLNATNAGALLPTLNHPAAVKADIENWTRQGLTVEVPRDPVTHHQWTGSVWRVLDPVTGAAGYFIAGGLAGGSTSQAAGFWILQWLYEALAAANTVEPNDDPLAGAYVHIAGGDWQEGEVGTELEQQLMVLVRDSEGRPVVGAPVTFALSAGGGQVVYDEVIIDPVTGQEVVNTVKSASGGTTSTNYFGLARIRLELGKVTKDSPVYVMRNAGDRNTTQAGMNIVDAFAATYSGSLSVVKPFQAIGLPKAPVKLVRTNGGCCWGAALPADPGDLVHDGVNVQVQDEYDNSISNIDVSFALTSSGDGGPGRLEASCCTGGSINVTTDVHGAFAAVHLGTALTYQLSASASVGQYTIPYSLERQSGYTYSFMRIEDEEGHNIAAAKVGNRFKYPVRTAFHYYYGYNPDSPNDRRYIPLLADDVSIEVSNGGSGSAPASVGPGEWESSSVFVGPSPGINEVKIRARVHNKDYPNTPDSFPEGLPGTYPIINIYGLDPKITNVVSTGAEPGIIPLNEEGRTLGPVDILYDAPPAQYHSASTEVDILKDGAWNAYSIGSTRTGSGKAPLPREKIFELDKPYQAQVVINRGGNLEVKSEPFNLPLRQKIFKDYRRSVHVSMDVDTLNQRYCSRGSEFWFVLSQPAQVKLEAIDVDNPSSRRTVFSSGYGKGEHRVPLLPSDLSPGKYRFELIGTSDIDGHTETEHGQALSEYETRNALPVGHVIVKGVDLKDGHLSIGGEDFSVAGRGAALSFSRSYNSAASHVPGALGVRWTHNYDSKIVINECAEVIVIGGEGSGMRFVDDGQGGLKPLKGYHGTLIPNHANRTFDFYSKDGTRYHYRNMGMRDAPAEWQLEFIEDTNGNVTKLGYDPTNHDVAKLITVEDASGRTLAFTYEDKTFSVLGQQTAVITKMEGPGGMSISFTYDADGNLTEAARENGARIDRYTYSPPNRLLPMSQVLIAHRNGNGATTSYTYNSGQTTVQPNGVVMLTMENSYVTQVTDGANGNTSFTYDTLNWQQATVTDPRGSSTSYSLNFYGSPLSISDPAGTTTMTWAADDVVMTSKTDANGVRTSYTYDADANLLSETVGGYTTRYTYASFSRPIKNRVATKTDRNGRKTSYSYDGRGNLVSLTDANGGVTTHVYAGNGDRAQTKDANGNVTRFTYDAYGNVESTTNAIGGTTRTQWNVRSLPTSVTDPLGRTTRLEHDTLNLLVRKTNAMGGTASYTYDPIGNKLTETDEENRRTRYVYDNENRLTSVTNALNASKHFTYDGGGIKTSETDWNGNTTTYVHDGAGRLTTRTEPLGKVARFTYDSVGNVKSETDALGRVTTYDYDNLNRRIRATNALSGITEYGYDGVGNKVSEKDPLGRLVTYSYDGLDHVLTKTEPLGKVTTYTYDKNGNRLSETDALGHVRKFVYDPLNRLIKRTDALVNTTNFEYDAVGNLTQEIDARLYGTRHEYDALNRRIRTIDPTGAVTTFGYDKVGNRVQEGWPNGNAINNTYDALNRVTASSDSVGVLASYTYDANGNRTQETDARGNTTIKTYDALNRLTRVDMPEARTMQYAYDAVGNKTRETDPNGNATTFAYDALNRVTTVTDPLTRTVRYTYDAVGNRKTETDKRNNVTAIDYDDLNRVVTITDPLSQTVRFTYDAVGNKKTETDKRGTVIEYAYDAENRVIQSKKAGVIIGEIAYDEVGNKHFDKDANGNITAYIYDARNLLLTESRPLAAITNHTYDAVGNRVQVRDPENRISTYTYDLRRRALTETNPANETTTYNYDGNGNRTSVRRAKGNTWTYAYDAANRLTAVTDPESGSTRYTYDKNGNRLSQTDANNNTTGYEYDALNRQTAMVYADGARATFAYDENGNRTGLTDPNGQGFNYVFDALNRETQKNYPLPSSPTGDDIQQIAFEYDANGNQTRVTETYSGATGTRITSKSYDTFDRLVSITDAFGETISHGYDANGNRITLTDPDNTVSRYTYDALNRVTHVTNGGGTTTYTYDRSSLKVKVAYPNNTTAVQGYDAARRILYIENRQNGAIVSRYDYTYDANGNRLSQIEVNGGAAETTAYAYDNNDRLIEARYPDKTTAYAYDAVGNRLTERTISGAVTQVNRSYSYNDRNQVATVMDSVNAADSATYGYDTNGNQTTKTKNGVVTTFVYDVRDQLISVREDATTRGRFFYDYQGMRVVKEGADGVVRYVYDEKSVLVQTDAAGQTIAKYEYGPDRLLSLTHATEGRQFYLFDALGSVVDLTTPLGTVQVRYQYDAWGNFRAQVGDSWNDFTFTGHEKDQETGLYYFKARFYDPDLGRFISQDPYLGDIDTPPSLHRYLYAYANPTVYIDLYGYYSWSEFWDDTKEAGRNAGRFVKGAATGAKDLVVGVAHLGFTAGYEVLATTYDLEQAVYYGVKGAITGKVEDVQWTSAMGRMAEQGASTGDIAKATATGAGHVTKEVVKGIANIPIEYADAIASGDPERIGKATFNIEAALVPFLKGGKAAPAAEAGAAETMSTQVPKQAGKVVGEAAEGPGVRAPTNAQATQRPSSQVASKEITPAETQAPRAASEPRAASTTETAASRMREPADAYDTAAWQRYYEANPGMHRSVGAAATKTSGVPKYVYDAKANRFRDTETGRFVAQRDLPWPGNRGFAASTRETLSPGTVVDRLGRPSGRYAGRPGATVSERGMAQGTDALEYHRYEVVKPVGAEVGPAAAVPEFGATGGATQYLFDQPMQELIKRGVLKELK